MKTVFVTVSDDRAGRKGGKYRETQERIDFFLKSKNIGIDKFCKWGIEDIKKTKFYEESIIKGRKTENDIIHPVSKKVILPKDSIIPDIKILDLIDPAENGRVYKPLCIKEELDKLEEGDFLIYNDCSLEIWDYFLSDPNASLSEYNLDVIRNLCESNNGILTAHVRWNYKDHVNNDIPGYHTHENFTTDRCMEEMGLSCYKHSLQHASGMIVIKKNEKSIRFVDEWLYWNSNPYCGGIGAKWDPLFWFNEVVSKGKIGHRHDQSVSGLLINAMNNKIVQTLDWYERPKGSHPYNFLFFCNNKYEYKFFETNQPPTKEVYKMIHINEDNWEIEKNQRDI
jgi:hypothetical protein